nr:hypothetical protein [Shewanella corallii]
MLVASILLVICGLVHSILGEKYILIRLFRRDNLPHLFGSDEFTKGTLRFAWHITTLAWFGFAAILVLQQNNASAFLYAISVVFALSALCSAYFTQGKHLSWVVFGAVSALCYLNTVAS